MAPNKAEASKAVSSSLPITDTCDFDRLVMPRVATSLFHPPGGHPEHGSYTNLVHATAPLTMSKYLSLAYTDRLAELGIAPSVGSRGDSYDNALAEAVNAAYKTELIARGNPGDASTTSN
jgi:hypothetical protein